MNDPQDNFYLFNVFLMMCVQSRKMSNKYCRY